MRLNNTIPAILQSMQEHYAQFRSLNRRSLEVLSPIPLEESIPQVSHEARPKTGSEYIDDRWGIGEAQSTSVQLLNKRRQIVDDFEKQTSNDSNFIFLSKPYQGRSVWDSDYSSTRRRSLGSNTKRRGIVIPALKGTGYIDLEIDSLPLLEGTHEPAVAMSDTSEIHEYDHWERRIRFNVFQYGIYDEGLVLPASQWGQTQQN